MQTPEIFGYVIFCEDVRKEINNQHSYIGVYGSAIEAIDDDPPVLPLLSLVVNITFSTSFAHQSPAVTVDVEEADGERKKLILEELPPIPEAPPGKTGQVSATLYFRLEGPPVSIGDRVSVEVNVGDQAVPLGSLMVIKAEPSDKIWSKTVKMTDTD